ncbi:MAG: YbaB/EbfC family nucleoid-associated protein [Acidimicrobiales bacterium]
MTDQNPAGGFDLGGLLAQAQAMQEQMAQAQEESANTVVTGTSGGEKVKIQMTGAGSFESVSIDASVVDADDVEMLEDLVLAALRDAAAQVMELQQNAMDDVGMPDLGALGGLLGGS